ncbi:hypothetical protein, partial [uncultured Porphyromonas sp.]|uniref:hypothetical protein n=1 Tax=uncultured Porphyromonas sp. TaxID=159274 RepID=UPI00260DE206
ALCRDARSVRPLYQRLQRHGFNGDGRTDRASLRFATHLALTSNLYLLFCSTKCREKGSFIGSFYYLCSYCSYDPQIALLRGCLGELLFTLYHTPQGL